MTQKRQLIVINSRINTNIEWMLIYRKTLFKISNTINIKEIKFNFLVSI